MDAVHIQMLPHFDPSGKACLAAAKQTGFSLTLVRAQEMHLHSSQTCPRCRLESAFADLPLGQRRSVLPHWHTPCTLQPRQSVHPYHMANSSITNHYMMYDIIWCSSCHGKLCWLTQQRFSSSVHRVHSIACTSQESTGHTPLCAV